MVCSEGCGRGSACAGSAAAGHSRLLAEGTKEEERSEEASLSSAFGEGGREGRRRRDKWLGKLPVLSPAAPGNCCLLARGAGQGPQHRVAGRGGVKRGVEKFRSSAPGCCAVSSQGFWSTPTFAVPFQCPFAGLIRKTYSQVSSFPGENFSFKFFGKAVYQFYVLSHLLSVRNRIYRLTWVDFHLQNVRSKQYYSWFLTKALLQLLRDIVSAVLWTVRNEQILLIKEHCKVVIHYFHFDSEHDFICIWYRVFLRLVYWIRKHHKAICFTSVYRMCRCRKSANIKLRHTEGMLLKKWLILPPHTHTLLGRFSIIGFSE